MSGADGRPLVTIVIPACNRRRFVAEAVESVLEQDYPHLEVILIDDGSSDGTMEITRGYANSHPDRVRWFHHENIGEAHTMNRGFELARGELIGRFCDDDRMLPGAITKLVAALLEDPEAVLAYSGWRNIAEDGRPLETRIPMEFSLVESVRKMDFVAGTGALFRRSVVEQIGGWDPELTHTGDWDFLLRAASVGRFRRIPEPLFEWRQHPGRKGGQEQFGIAGARSYVKMLDKAFARPEQAAALEPVRIQAYRNAYVLGAWAAGPGMNAYGERFYIADRHWGRDLDPPPDPDARVAELSTENWRRLDEIAERDRQIEWQAEHIRAVEAHRDALVEHVSRPWWLRLWQKLWPARSRP